MEKRLIIFFKVLIFGSFISLQSNSSLSSQYLIKNSSLKSSSINYHNNIYKNTYYHKIFLSTNLNKKKSDNKSKKNTKENLTNKPKKVSSKLKTIEFDDLIKFIDDNNLELKAEKSKLKQFENNLSIVNSEFKPSLQLMADGLPQYTFGEGDNPKRQSRELKGSLSATMSYKLYDPETSHKVKLSNNQLLKAQAAYDILRSEIISRTESLFIELQLASNKVEIAKNAFLLSESSLKDANILNKALVVPDIEVLEAESQLSRDKKFLNDKINELDLITISFSEIMGVNKQLIEKNSFQNKILGFWEMDLDETKKFAISKNKELEKLKFDLKISKNKSDKELGKSKPSVSLVNKLSSSINQGQSNISPPINFNKTGSEYQNTIGLIAKWDIFNGGKNKYIRQLNKNKTRELNLKFKDKENKIKKQVSENFKLLKTSLKNIYNTYAQVQNNKNILKISRLRFNAGVASQREIINNQRDLTQSKILYAESIANYNKNLIDLKKITYLNSLKKCENSEKLINKTNTAFNEIDLSLACDLPLINEEEFSLNSPEYEQYKNFINEIINDKFKNKSTNFEENIKRKEDNQDNSQENIKRKEDNQDNSQEKKIYLEESKIINSQDDCDEINNAQSQKNCLDTYL